MIPGLYSKLLAFFSLFLLNKQGGEELPDLPSSEADPGILPTEIRTLVERRKQVRRALFSFDPLSAKFIKWSNTLKQIVGKLPMICLSVFDHFSGFALKGLNDLAKCLLRRFFPVKHVGWLKFWNKFS